MKQEDGLHGIFKAMIVCSFIMLSMLTWAAGPIQKLVEKVQYKETIKAKLKVCSEIRSMLPVYEEWTRTLFINGCLWQARGFLFAVMPEKEDEIRKQFKDQEGKMFDDMNNACIQGAAAQQEENNIRDMVLSPIYHTKLDCPALYDEAEKLGIKEEDVQQ